MKNDLLPSISIMAGHGASADERRDYYRRGVWHGVTLCLEELERAELLTPDERRAMEIALRMRMEHQAQT